MNRDLNKKVQIDEVHGSKISGKKSMKKRKVKNKKGEKMLDEEDMIEKLKKLKLETDLGSTARTNSLSISTNPFSSFLQGTDGKRPFFNERNKPVKAVNTLKLIT